jgi:hypothetical protein
MRRLFVAATVLGLGLGGSAFAQSTTTPGQSGQGADLWAEVTCSEFMATSEASQREIIASLAGSGQGMDPATGSEDSRSAATGGAADAEENMAINSGADVSAGTRGVDQSGTAALTAEGEAGDPAGTNYNEVAVSDVVDACEGSPQTRVSEVIDRERTQ